MARFNGIRIALVATLPLAALACSGGDSWQAPGAPQEEVASSTAEALTTSLPAGTTAVTGVAAVNIGSCIYQVGHAQLATPPFPPQYIGFVHKFALAPSCAAPYGYQVLGTSYIVPNVAIALAANNTLAADYEYTGTPSGSAHKALGIKRLDPANLNILASDTLAVPPGPSPSQGNVYSGALVFTVPGALLVTGTKDGTFPGELGAPGGANYQATFPGFATSTTSNVAPSQVLAW